MNEAESPGAASAASPVTNVAPTGPAELAPVIDSGLPSVVPTPVPPKGPSPAASSQLIVELKHTLRSGTLVLTVDGAKVLQERIGAPRARSILGVKLREGRARRVVQVKPGRHQIGVHVAWDDERRSRAVVGTFQAAGSRRVVASLSRLTKNLSLEWR